MGCFGWPSAEATCAEGHRHVAAAIYARRMNERDKAVKAVVDAWIVPGIDPQHHANWQARLSAPSPEGWPVLARSVKHLVDVESDHVRGNHRKRAIDAVVDAWTVPGIDPAHHANWQAALSAPSPQGWPVLARAVKHLVEVEQQPEPPSRSSWWRFGKR